MERDPGSVRPAVHRRRGGGVPLLPPPPRTQGTIVGNKEMYHREMLCSTDTKAPTCHRNTRAVLKNPPFPPPPFFFLRTAPEDHQPPTATNRPPLFSSVSVASCLAHVLPMKRRAPP